MRTNGMTTTRKEPRFEHRAMQALKRRLKFERKMTKEQCAEYVRKLLKKSGDRT
jgi:hypothetical protein